MAQSISQVLEERDARYGVFMGQAQIAQSFHVVFEEGYQLSGKNRFSFDPDELEALGMIFNKIARITNGDPHYVDSWRDIAGYATLIANRLDNDSKNIIEEENNDELPTWEQSIEQSEGRKLPINGTSSETRVTVRRTPRR